MLPELLEKLAVGVKTAVRVIPVPLIAPKVPPVVSTSPTLPSQAKLLPGSSVKVKVMAAVSPDLKSETSEGIDTLGARVSIEIEGEEPVEPVLLAASE